MCWLQTPAERPLLLEVQRRAGTLDAMSPAVDTSLVARAKLIGSYGIETCDL